MEDSLYETIQYAKKHNTIIITTVEGFYKEPKLLYDYLRQCANHGVTVTLAPIETTDQSAPYKGVNNEQ